MILKRLKEKAVYKIIKKEYKKDSGKAYQKGPVKSVLFIINFDQITNLEPFMAFSKRLGVAPHETRFAGFVQKTLKNVVYPIPVFSEKEISWKGKIKNEGISQVLQAHYDIVFNYFRDEQMPLVLFSSQVSAGLRIGLGNGNTSISDLLIETSSDDLKPFESEVFKYLNIINKS